MDAYFEKKKRQGFIFTKHNIDGKHQYISMCNDILAPRPIEQPDGPIYWSHLSGRYRTAEEQKEFMDSGMIDRKLPALGCN